MKKPLKNKYNKGMALAATLIVMAIVLVMSGLMLSYTLFGSQLTGLSTSNLETRSVLDQLGNSFVSNPLSETFSATGIEEYNDNNDNEYKLKVKTEGNYITLSVLTRKKGTQIMRVTCENKAVGGNFDYQLVSWRYD